ncbi:MAG: hypothetical protein ACI4AX_04530 [Muribaculaceae bacterium]
MASFSLSRRGASTTSAIHLIVFALTIALPWLDFAFTVIFALNYVWTGALT